MQHGYSTIETFNSSLLDYSDFTKSKFSKENKAGLTYFNEVPVMVPYVNDIKWKTSCLIQDL